MPDYDFEPPFEVGYPENPDPVIAPAPEPSYGNPYEPSPLPGDVGGSPIGVEGPGGSPPGLGGAQFDWASFLKAPAEYLTKIFGSSQNSAGVPWTQVLKGLGLSSGGGLGLTDILSLAALFGTGANAIHSRNEASQELKDAMAKSNEQIQGVVDRSNAQYAPYITAGTNALDKWANLGSRALADKFQSHGTPSNAAAKFHGTMSLSDLLKR